ncbi:MAG: hypothetical protein IJ444_06435 [Kiritimatiellae bacterium]|nr:hypothetical protein [Kiritimatiellia bacterium]
MIKKRNFIGITFIVAFLITLFLPMAALANGADAAVQEHDRATAELAASLVLAKLNDEIYSEADNSTPVFEAMVADTATHAEPNVSKEKLQNVYTSAIKERYKEEAIVILDRLAAPKSRAEVFGEAFLELAQQPSEELLVNAVEHKYSSVFTSARTRACKEQAERLTATVRPSEQEVDDLSREELTSRMTERVAKAQKETVFQENLGFISEQIVAPMLNEAYKQRDEQRHYVERTSVDGYAPSRIVNELQKKLDDELARRRSSAKEGQYIYNCFPSLKKQLEEIARNRAFRLYEDKINTLALQLDAATVQRELDASPEKHRKLEDSEKHFMPMLQKQLCEQAFQAIINAAKPDERDEVTSFIKGHNEKAQQAPAVARLKRELTPLLKEVRKQCAQKQFEGMYSELADGSWYPAASLVDSVCESPNFKKTLDNWRELIGLEKFARVEQQRVILEETSKLVFDKIVDGFDQGSEARSAQHRLVDNTFPAVRNEVKNMEQLPPVEQITQIFSAKVSAAWTEERLIVIQFPEGKEDDSRFSELFPSTIKKIELLSKTLLEQLEKEKQEEIKPEEKPIEDPNETPPEEKEKILLDCVIVFDRKGDSMNGAVLLSGKRIAEFNCPHNPDKFKQGRTGFVNSVAGALAQEVQKAAVDKLVSLTVTIDVRDDLVYYSAVSGVSFKLRRELEALGEAIESLEIYDEATSAPQGK